MKTTFAAITLAIIAGCGGNSDPPAQTLGEAVTGLQARVDAGATTAAEASAIVQRWVAMDVAMRTAAGTMTAAEAANVISPARAVAMSDRKHPELGWFGWFMIISRGLSLSGDTCPTCDLLTWPIDFGTGDGWGGGSVDMPDNADAH